MLALCFLGFGTASAQTPGPEGPIYIVQEGDTLSTIAIAFSVTVDDLVRANGLADANALFVGDRLVIPGLSGITGILETELVPFGANLRSLSRMNRIPPRSLIQLNRLVSPAELHKGASLVLARSQRMADPHRMELLHGETLLEAALRSGANPWGLAGENGAETLARVVPGDVFFTDRAGDGAGLALPPSISALEINLLFQGEAAVIAVDASQNANLSGTLGPYRLNFVDSSSGPRLALQGLHALLIPGYYPLQIVVDEPGRAVPFAFTQLVRVNAVDYIFESISVPPELIDPETGDAENAVVQPFLEGVSADKLWAGIFEPPSPFEDCINSTFGNRRSYNGSAFTFYHSGVDFCGGTGVEIYAPADGVVVFTGLLDIRGNFTVIDHGWGVLTAYMHQSEILVERGDAVETGEVIGRVGSTGRSTGPHLHWEVWVGGIPVNPLPWLAQPYP